MAAFSSILSRPSNQAEPPPQPPAGTYVALVKGPPTYDKSAKKKTDYAEFKMVLQEPFEEAADVDEDELAAFVERSGPILGKEMKYTLYLTDASEYRLREFLDHCGIDDQDKKGKDLSHAERIDRVPNAQVLVHVSHTASEDGKRIFANIDSTAPMPD